MRMPIAVPILYLYLTLILLLLFFIQVRVFQNLRFILSKQNFSHRLLLAGIFLMNIPQVILTYRFFTHTAAQSPFFLKSFASLYFFVSLSFVVFMGLSRWVHLLSFKIIPRILQRISDKPREERSIEFAASRRKFLQRAAMGFGGIAASGTLSGFALARGRPSIEHVDLFHPELPPGFDGTTIVQLSDFHAGPFMSREDLLRIREMAERFQPDIFALTGDFADSHASQVPDIVEALQQLQGKIATLAILGNHDYYAGFRAVEQGLKEAELPLLRNQNKILERDGHRLAIVGVDDRWARRWGKDRGPNFKAALESLPANMFKICLSHQPQLWPQCLRNKIQITLSGHTHGGQIGIPNTQISLARLASPYVAGVYRRGRNLLYVNRGLGTVGLPLRIGVPPEITLLRLWRTPSKQEA